VAGSARVLLSLDVAAKVSGYPKPIPVTLIDLSATGCRVTARSVLLVGATLEFRLQLSRKVDVAARARVLRCVPTALGGMEYGLEFAPFSAGDLAALRAFVEEESSRTHREKSAARIEVEFPVECILQGQKDAIAALAIDLGRGGMRFACEQALPEGSALALRFVLPGDPATAKSMVMRGRIVQRTHQFREYHHSIAFVDPDALDIERIERFMLRPT